MMPGVRDWIDLGKNTVNSLSGDDVARLYAAEWSETKRQLIEDHRQSINEAGTVGRYSRTASAIMYGLAKRLSPARRILFLVAIGVFFITLFRSLLDDSFHFSATRFALFVLPTVALTFLLALELIDKIKFRDELELARDLQASLLPTELPKHPPFELAAWNRIANTVGGDVYDFAVLPDARLAVLFGDASGHGMAAGLVMAVASASWRTQLDIDPSPRAIMSSLNRILCRTGGSRSFFSAVYLLIEQDGRFEATVAGHPQVLHLSPRGTVVDRIGHGAYPLGIKTSASWETVSGTLSVGETLLLHSDGVSEAMNAEGRYFGYELVETIAGWVPGARASELIETIVNELQTFTRNRPVEDDVTLAAIRMEA